MGYQPGEYRNGQRRPRRHLRGARRSTTQCAIVARLTAGEATGGELAAPYDMSLAAVSKHLEVLENAGLIARSPHAQWRPCHLRAVSEWVGGHRDSGPKKLASLRAYLAEIERGTAAKAAAQKKRKGTAR